MPGISQESIEILGRLALEYQQKQNELDTIIQNADPDRILQQLVLRAELTTDHFRGAQRVLLNFFSSAHDGETEEAKRAAVGLCRSFDEMRLLFQAVAALPVKTGE